MSKRNQPEPPARSTRLLRLAAFAAAALVIGAYLLLPVISSSEWLRSRLVRAAADTTGNDVRIDELALGYDLGLHLTGLSVAGPQRPPFLMSDHVTVRLSPAGLFSGQPLALELGRPRIFLDNLPKSGGPSGPISLPFRTVDIGDGHVVISEDSGEIGPITVSVDAVQSGQEVRVSVEVDPRLPPVDIVAIFAVPEGRLTVESSSVSWRGVPMAIVAQRFGPLPDGTVVEGMLDFGGEAAGPLDTLSGSGNASIDGFGYRTDAFELAGDVTAPVVLDGNVIDLSDPGIQLDNVAFVFAGMSGSASQAVVAGEIVRDGEVIRGTGKLSVSTIQAQDAAYERVIENLEIEGAVSASWSGGDSPVVRIRLSTSRGELLWDRFYADVSRHPVAFDGEIQSKSTGIEVSKIDARAAGIGGMKGDLRLRLPTGVDRLAARVDVTHLGNLYGLAVREPYKERFPFLSTTTLSGALRARIDYKNSPGKFALSGELHVADVSATAGEPAFELHGLSLDLPLQLGSVKAGEPDSGRLQVTGVRAGNVAVGDIDAALRVLPNVIELAREVSIHLLGGTLQLTQFRADGLASPQPRAALGMALRRVDLEALTAAMGLPPLRGTITGAIPKITAADGEVRSEGEIRILAFGGTIAVRNLSVDQLFSSVPTLGLDLDFDNLALGELTETLEVGRISGIARGAARNMAIVNGQPLRFDAWMETVEQSGVPQRISVSAIRQLSILGGSGGDPFSQGILSLFDEYRYAKMGFRCRLENDRFLLRGVETHDGKEYLVVGSFLPPRVNVVSHNQVISFSEMVRRLQRVTSSSPTEEKGEKE